VKIHSNLYMAPICLNPAIRTSVNFAASISIKGLARLLTYTGDTSSN